MDSCNSHVQEGDENPRELEAKDYLEAHRIDELLNNMTAMLIYARPGNLIALIH